MKTKKLRKIKILLIAATVLAVVLPLGSTVWVHKVAESRICNADNVPHCKVALVLGSKVYPSGKLSGILKDRVDTAINLYKMGKVDKLLMSGDNRFNHYNEPQRMCDYAVSQGVPAGDIVMDFAGRRTYDSIYRARHIFGQERLIVVTQRFHIDRALFLCNRLGVDAYGVSGKWTGKRISKIREIPACMSAVLDTCVLHPTPVGGKKEKI